MRTALSKGATYLGARGAFERRYRLHDAVQRAAAAATTPPRWYQRGSLLYCLLAAQLCAAATLGIKRYFSLDASLKLWSFRLL